VDEHVDVAAREAERLGDVLAGPLLEQPQRDHGALDPAERGDALPQAHGRLGATCCGPCKALLPVLERLARENVGRVRVAEADIEESPGLAKRFGIRGAPTVVVFRGGREVARHLGVTNRARLEELLGL
jgi:thiol-disulfide isomerase/thioredoxin